MVETIFNNQKEYFDSLDEKTKEHFREYYKIRQRVLKHGTNLVHKSGRPKVSESHKKRRRKEYLEKIREKKKAEGTYVPRGRPRKKSE